MPAENEVEFGSDDTFFVDPGTGARRTIQERTIVENRGYFAALLTGNQHASAGEGEGSIASVGSGATTTSPCTGRSPRIPVQRTSETRRQPSASGNSQASYFR